jgi:hypothetical protein
MVQVLSLAHRGTGKGNHEGRVRSLEKQIFSRDTHSIFPAPPLFSLFLRCRPLECPPPQTRDRVLAGE